MSTVHSISKKFLLTALLVSAIFVLLNSNSTAQSLDIPSSKWGLSIGNSKNFTGLRFNFRDHNVEKIVGINVTLWRAYDNDWAEVQGISFGVVPQAGYLKGLQIGIGGVAAEKELSGISLGILGAGAGGDVSGVAIGGLGVGAGESLKGVFVGGLGVGSGGDVSGVMIGGLGAGAGGSMKGISIGLLGIGAGEDLYGLNIGGLGAGAGRNVAGISIGLLGIGAGNNMTGINVGGLGAGAGNRLTGITIGGLGAGAPIIRGVTIAGLGVGGRDIKGVSLAIGMVRIEKEGSHTGFAASAFNFIKGQQNGVSMGIFNYAYKLKGFQIGILNYVRDNPKFLKLLPFINFNF